MKGKKVIMKGKCMKRKGGTGIMLSVVAVVAATVLCVGCNGEGQTSGTTGDAVETADTEAEITETADTEVEITEAELDEEAAGIAEEEVGTAEGESGQEEAATAGRVPYADEMAAIADASVGDIVYWGSYEQDNDPENGTEPVEWYVLDKADGEATLLAVYLLDCQPYHEAAENITWEDCTLRSWLNGEFYNTAFSEEEQAAIANTNVANEGNPHYGTEGGNDTSDQVWLLSLREIEGYFHIDPDVFLNEYRNGNMNGAEYSVYCYGQDNRVCAKPTAYLSGSGLIISFGAAQYYLDEYGIDTSYAEGCSAWWLRSPGDSSVSVALVNMSGGVIGDGGSVDDSLGVRPALKVTY